MEDRVKRGKEKTMGERDSERKCVLEKERERKDE